MSALWIFEDVLPVPNRSKQKGDRQERAIVELLRAAGLDAYRVPLSGAVSGFKDDIEIRLGNQTWRLESKVRSKGFRNIYKWLGNSNALVIKADREQPLIIMELNQLTSLIHHIAHNQTEKPTDKLLINQVPEPTPINPRPQTSIKDLNLLSPNNDCLVG